MQSMKMEEIPSSKILNTVMPLTSSDQMFLRRSETQLNAGFRNMI